MYTSSVQFNESSVQLVYSFLLVHASVYHMINNDVTLNYVCIMLILKLTLCVQAYPLERLWLLSRLTPIAVAVIH